MRNHGRRMSINFLQELVTCPCSSSSSSTGAINASVPAHLRPPAWDPVTTSQTFMGPLTLASLTRGPWAAMRGEAQISIATSRNLAICTHITQASEQSSSSRDHQSSGCTASLAALNLQTPLPHPTRQGLSLELATPNAMFRWVMHCQRLRQSAAADSHRPVCCDCFRMQMAVWLSKAVG